MQRTPAGYIKKNSLPLKSVALRVMTMRGCLQADRSFLAVRTSERVLRSLGALRELASNIYLTSGT